MFAGPLAGRALVEGPQAGPQSAKGGVDSPPERGYTIVVSRPTAHVGAIGFDGAQTDARLREEVVGTLSKPPATHKCQHWHAHGCLKRGSHVRPDSPAGSGSGVTTRASRPVRRERRRRTLQSRLGQRGSCRSEPPRPRRNRPTTRVDVSCPGHPDVGSIPTASTSLRSPPVCGRQDGPARFRLPCFSHPQDPENLRKPGLLQVQRRSRPQASSEHEKEDVPADVPRDRLFSKHAYLSQPNIHQREAKTEEADRPGVARTPFRQPQPCTDSRRCLHAT